MDIFILASERFFWKSSAEESLKKAKKQLSKDLTLESFNGNILEGGGIDKYFWVTVWKHKDNADTCQSYTIEETFSPPVMERILGRQISLKI